MAKACLNEDGFTMIELILVIILLAIIGASIFVFFLPGIQSYLAMDFRKEGLQNSRVAMQRVLSETRQARDFAACSPCVPANTLSFTDTSNSVVIFSWAGAAQNPLLRNGSVQAANVDDFTVTFFDQGGGVPADQSLIWLVRVELRVRVGDQPVDLRSEVHPRN